LRFELVRERLRALPREMPAAPAILTPIRIDSPRACFRHGRWRRSGRRRCWSCSSRTTAARPRPADHPRVAPELACRRGQLPRGSAERATRTGGDRTPGVGRGDRPGPECLRAPGDRRARALHDPVSGFRVTPWSRWPSAARSAAPTRTRWSASSNRRSKPSCRRPGRARRADDSRAPDRYGVYPVEGERVWGATARMLGQLGALLATEPAPETEPRPKSRRRLLPSANRRGSAGDRRRPTRYRCVSRRPCPELARALPPVSELFVAESAGFIAGLAGWAPWDRPRAEDESRGFDGLGMDEEGRAPAELTLLAVTPNLRGRGIGRSLTDAIAVAAGSTGRRRLLPGPLPKRRSILRPLPPEPSSARMASPTWPSIAASRRAARTGCC